MKLTAKSAFVIALGLLFALGVAFAQVRIIPQKPDKRRLPGPILRGEKSLEEVISKRRTVRSFAPTPLTLRQLSQILWAAQGITDTANGFRTVPSAGALYPLELYVACGDDSIKGLKGGLWRYDPKEHSVVQTGTLDRRKLIALHSHHQMWAADAPITLVIACEYSRTTKKYGERGVRYVHFEAGNLSQNVSLQAQSLGLSTAIIGAFSDRDVRGAMALPEWYEPLLVMPLGYKAAE